VPGRPGTLQYPFVRRGTIDEEWLVVAKPLADATRAPQSEQTSGAPAAPAAPAVAAAPAASAAPASNANGLRFGGRVPDVTASQVSNGAAASGDAAATATLAVQQRIYLEEFYPLHEASDVLVLDVRDRESYREGHIPGAIFLPQEQFAAQLDRLRAERRTIVTYCSCPAEETSGAAVLALARHGITNAKALVGGYRLWAARKQPISTGDEPCSGPTCPLKTTRSTSR
jgi:rhodanese-related sulfurtransferase